MWHLGLASTDRAGLAQQRGAEMARKTSTYARKMAIRDSFGRVRHTAINPVTEAVVRQAIQENIERLRNEAGLQAFMGGDCARVVNMVGRMTYIVCHAAGCHGLGNEPEARILAGTASALGDMRGHMTHAVLEQQRNTLIAGLAAADRLMPRLSTWALAEGAIQLDALIASASGMGTSDVERALKRQISTAR